MSESVITRNFEENWNIIVDEFNKQKDNDLFPFTYSSSTEGEQTMTVEAFQTTLDHLHDEKFTIAVCGVVKAGKSTFLNSLLFGNDVLPAFDTPMTAKLTFIEYTDGANYTTISFYTKKEWETLKQDLIQKYPVQSKQLEERMELCFSKYGISEQNCIDAPDKTINNLQLLEEYVTDPKTKGGKYTPFVKNVHIYVKNESIRNLRIVDTPGLNDPNIINSLETEKWIRNTHALIFLLQPKGMNESDLNFFDVHLSNTSAGNRVFIINKIDDLDDGEWMKTRAYLKSLGKNEEFIKRGHLFGEQESICGYSALLAMLKNMRDLGCPMNEDQEWYLSDKEDFDPDPDHIAEKIAAKLYTNTGVKRVASGVNLILQVYSTHIKQLEKDIMLAENQLNDTAKTMEELQNEVKNLDDFIKQLNSRTRDITVNLNDIVQQILEENFVKQMQRELDKFIQRIINEIMICKTAEGLRNLVYLFHDECDKIFGEFGSVYSIIRTTRDKIKDELCEVSCTINREFARKNIDSKIDCSEISDCSNIKFDLASVIENIQSALTCALPDNKFTEFFTSTATMQEETKGKFMSAKDEIRKQLTDKGIEFRGEVISNNEKEINKLQVQIQELYMSKKRLLAGNQEDKSKMNDEAQKKLDVSKARLSSISDMRRAFELHLPQTIKNNIN